jgi:hypothetical protein
LADDIKRIAAPDIEYARKTGRRVWIFNRELQFLLLEPLDNFGDHAVLIGRAFGANFFGKV